MPDETLTEREALMRIAQIHSDDIDEGRHYCIMCGALWPCPTFQVLEAVRPTLWPAEEVGFDAPKEGLN